MALDNFPYSRHQHSGSRRATRDVAIHWDYGTDGSDYRMTTGEQSTADSAGSDRHNEFRSWYSGIGVPDSFSHIARNRAGNEQHVRVLWRRDEVNPKPFEIVTKVRKRRDLGLAAVARAGVELPNIERPAHERMNLGTHAF